MRAGINADGQLWIEPEDGQESYALEQWALQNGSGGTVHYHLSHEKSAESQESTAQSDIEDQTDFRERIERLEQSGRFRDQRIESLENAMESRSDFRERIEKLENAVHSIRNGFDARIEKLETTIKALEANQQRMHARLVDIEKIKGRVANLEKTRSDQANILHEIEQDIKDLQEQQKEIGGIPRMKTMAWDSKSDMTARPREPKQYGPEPEGGE